MSVSTFSVLLVTCVVVGIGVVHGARWISRRADTDLAETRAALRGAADPDADAPMATVDETPPGGRHRVPEELLHARTVGLSPDRIARARLPEATLSTCGDSPRNAKCAANSGVRSGQWVINNSRRPGHDRTRTPS
jgi:hypothetical protein